jgi:hypothetical protein
LYLRLIGDAHLEAEPHDRMKLAALEGHLYLLLHHHQTPANNCMET